MNKTLLLAACLSAATAFAHANDIKARQQYMKEWGGATKKMAAIIKKSDAQSFPAAEFAALAAQIQQNANAPWQHYPAGSNGRGSDATAAVWEQPQQFQAAIQRFSQAANNLHTAAQTGRFDAVKAPFGQLGESFKACHKTFKD